MATLFVSSMLAGEIFFLNPNTEDPESTVKKIHTFELDGTIADEKEAGDFGNGMVAEAIVEDPIKKDRFYTFSGKHGKSGSWAVFKVDMEQFDQEGTVTVDKVADVPWARWLNGATFIPGSSKLVVADSLLGQLISYDVDTGEVETWLEDPLLGKATGRLPWPDANGVQDHRGHILVTSSDRAILVHTQVEESTGNYVGGSLTVMAQGIAGDDLAFDEKGNAYVTTNPQQTVLRFPGIGLKDAAPAVDRFMVVGSWKSAETAGPTCGGFWEDREGYYMFCT